MARHSHWAQIKLKKGATDKKRGKVFTRHARLITIAAQSGGDPETNPSLRATIENAKAENVPNDNIERAIKKGTGEDKDSTQFHEVVYEGFAPGGIAIVVEALTDNKNRTAQFVRTNLEKYGGNLGAQGATAHFFKKCGVISMPKSDNAELAAIDAGADETEIEENDLIVYTRPSTLNGVRTKLQDGGFEIKHSEISYIPETEVLIEDEDNAQSITKMIDALEESDDVSAVWTNGDFNRLHYSIGSPSGRFLERE